MLHARRRLQDCFEIDIEEVIPVSAVVLERKLKHVITRNLGGGVRLEEA